MKQAVIVYSDTMFTWAKERRLLDSHSKCEEINMNKEMINKIVKFELEHIPNGF